MPGFVVCAVAGEGVSSSVAPCVDVEGAHYVPVVMNLPEPGTVTFDNANQLFAYALTVVLIFFFAGTAIGTILSLLGNRD